MLSRILLLIILLLAPFSAMIEPESVLDEDVKSYSGFTPSYANDVPSWHIDDEWVYDTDFDVAGLLSQVNVQASINTLTGETTETVEDIDFEVVDGVQHLVYKLKSEGDYSSGNNGATLEGNNGRLDIEYEGEDLIRVSDLATISSSMTIKVEFAPWNLGLFAVDLADLTIANSYDPPLEKYDFPLNLGETWYQETLQSTDGSGDSDYFEPDELDRESEQNNTYQVSGEGAPTEDGKGISYGGCGNSYKINEWNASGVNTGFVWYCPAARGKAWYNFQDPLGLEIDWKLTEYNPANSNSVVATSNPGGRHTFISVNPEFPAVLPDAEETIWGNYTWSNGPGSNTNLQVRYEIEEGIWNINTDSTGSSSYEIDVGEKDDESVTNDDMGSHGVIIWDPVPTSKIVGVRTVILDPNVVGIDLAARTDRVIIERMRGDESVYLSEATGWNAVPGDLLKMSLPAQNLGILDSPATEIEVITPDGQSLRADVPSLTAYEESRVEVNWTVPENQDIGEISLTFTVDPDQMVGEDANWSNNVGVFDIYVGKLPQILADIQDEVFTFEDVIIDATSSFDPDGGDFRCEFMVEVDDVEYNAWEEDCIWEFNWSDGGDWPVEIWVIDDENDKVHTQILATVLNRNPWLNLSAPASVEVESKVTVDATDHGDLDTINPNADVSISWPGILCEEGAAAHICTFTPGQEGITTVTAIATDDDNATTSVSIDIEVLNRAPTLSNLSVWNQSGQLSTWDGSYDILENEEILLMASGDDSLNDLNSLIFNWWIDATDEANLSDGDITTIGWESNITTSFQSSGLHTVWVEIWDDDGEQSERIEVVFDVENVAPTMDALPQIQPVWEDQMVWINATGADSPSDMETWTWCWDLLPTVNSDGNGTAADDCDVEGPDLAMSWNESGLKEIVVWVKDDDGASVSQSTMVDVRNKPPRAGILINNESDDRYWTLTVDDVLDISAANSSDTASDEATLRFIWDHDGLDGNGDGDLSNDIDHEGMYYTPTFDRVGTYTITLTVRDDDGSEKSEFIEILVEPKPEEGLLAGFLGGEDGTTTALTSVLVILIIVILAVMFMRGGGTEDSDVDWNLPPSGGLLDQTHASMQAPVSSTLETTVQTTPTYDPVQVTPAYDPVQTPTPEPAPVISTAPPVPAGGLPAGWTMEQWEHYGSQWLAQNATATAPSPVQPQAPAPVQPTNTNAVSNLDNLLDDLDF